MKRITLWYIALSLSLKPRILRLIYVISFRLSAWLYSRSVPSKYINNLVQFFQIVL